MIPAINMLSSAEKVKGQGVGSAYREQVNLVTEALKDKFEVKINRWCAAEIMHYHTINFRYFLTLPLAKIKGKTVGYVHFLPETMDESLNFPKFIRKIFYWYVIRFYKAMDALVTVNPYFIEKLAAYGIKKEKITYIPNFVSEDSFYRLNEEELAETRRQYEIPDDAFVVLGVGQIQTRKGVMDFMEIARQMPSVTFLWAGGFSFGQLTSGYEELKTAVEHPPENLKFLGIIDRSEMNRIYNLCDVMFLPSFGELFPMSILEAMNSHRPILLRDLEEYKIILFDFYLKADNNDSFIELLSKLKSDSEFYQNACEMSRQGHIFYSKEHVVAMWEKFYTGLLNKN